MCSRMSVEREMASAALREGDFVSCGAETVRESGVSRM